jgi:pimeloyl-ACP methyl ester carboxylesterase
MWRFSSLPVVMVFMIFSCSKETIPVSSFEHKKLTNFEKTSTLNKSLIVATFATASVLYPEIVPLKDSTRYSVGVYRLEYKTTYKGQEIMASGLAAIPDAKESFPIIGFANGTNIAHAHAPTKDNSNTAYMLMAGMAGNGYILVIPDYIGFGASESIVHPYFMKEPTQASVIDLILATREYLDNHSEYAAYNGTYFLAGYSQGGWSALATLEAIDADPSLDMSVLAASCGGGAYDLFKTTDHILQREVFTTPYYLPNFIYSHIQYGSVTSPLDQFFLEPYASVIPELFNGSFTRKQVNDQLNDTIARMVTPDFINNYTSGRNFAELRDDMEINSISAWKTSSLLRFYHAGNDVNVPSSQSENMYRDFVRLGLEEQVEYIEMPDEDHLSGIYPWGIQTILWFNTLKTLN